MKRSPPPLRGSWSNDHARPTYTNGRGFAYLGSRDGQASLCILAGVDAEAIADVVRAFAKLKSVSSSGLQLAID